jgi:hypothetical protein
MKILLVFILGVLTIDVVHATLHPRPQPFCIHVGAPMQIKDSK